MSSKMLLHICCAPCSTSVVELLRGRSYHITGYFYNPNIHPESEYYKRQEELKRYAKIAGFDIICDEYDYKNWFEAVKGKEDLPEGSERCSICFEIRLKKAAEFALKNGYETFATTLTVSPHKDAKKINQIGTNIAKDLRLTFYEADFKKRGGFDRSVKLSKEFGLYRQSYCGCIFSKNESEMRRSKR